MTGRPVICRAFIGRHDELALLHEARRALAQSHASVMLIGGEAGIGKSRLLGQFLGASADGRARTIASGECLERAQQPFGPIRAILGALVRVMPPDELAPNEARALAQLVPQHLPASMAELRDAAPLEKAELFAALVSIFNCAAAKRAMILTIEDLHWADPSTLDFITYVASRITNMRIMLVATYRSEEVESHKSLFEAVSRLVREPNVRAVALEAFDTKDVRALIDGALEGHPALPPEATLDVEQRCEGNPFFAEELLKSALERRGSSGSSTLPLSIRASILQRVAVFAEDERRILAYAAVLGYRFDPTVLALVMGREVDTLLPTLRRARDLNVIVEENADRIHFRFRHALTRQTIYDDMLAFDARRLHEQMLNTFELLEDREGHLEELAYHAWEAKLPGKAFAYNERAGQAALAVRALPEARSCLERALELAPDEGAEVRLLEALGQVAQMQGRLQDAVRTFERALALRLSRGELDDAVRSFMWILGERSNLGELGITLSVDEFLAENGERLSASARDSLCAFAARISSARSDFEAMHRFVSMIASPQALPVRLRQNYLLARLNEAAYRGDAAAWTELTNELAGFASALPPYLRAIMLYSAGQLGTYLGTNAAVERALDDAGEICSQWGLSSIGAFGAAVRAAFLYERGRLEEARSCVEKALERPEIVVAQNVVAACGPPIALALGDEALGLRCRTDAALDNAREGEIDVASAAVLGSSAAWLAAHRQLPEAWEELRLAIRTLRRAPPSCATLLVVAASYLPLSEMARVHELARTAMAEGSAAGATVAAMVDAVVASRTGSAAEAQEKGLAAAAGFAEMGWGMLEARALEVAGKRGDALAVYERCGAVADVRRLAPPVAVVTSKRDSNARLSPREREVAELVTIGLTNGAIAERLTVSKKTVEKHLASIFTKLAVNSRAQIAAFIGSERHGNDHAASYASGKAAEG